MFNNIEGGLSSRFSQTISPNREASNTDFDPTKISSEIVLNAFKETIDIDISQNSSNLHSDKSSIMPLHTNEAIKVRMKNPKNAMIGYLNLNHIRNKVSDLQDLTDRLCPTVLGIGETKLDASFPNASLCLENYFNPGDYRRDRTRNGGGLLVYIRKGTPCKRLKIFEDASIESICFEITVKQRKWIIFSIYRPPYDNNLQQYFDYISKMVDKALGKNENFIIMGDLNIDSERDKGLKADLLRKFCDTYSFQNLIKAKTCFTKSSESSLDVILTNRTRLFFHNLSVETGISDVHTMVCTLMRTHVTRLKPIKIMYRNYKFFDEKCFNTELENSDLVLNESDPDKMYLELVDNFCNILEKHAPLKSRYIRGNNAAFMNKELRKAIMIRSKLKNTFNKIKSNENWRLYKKQRNICNKIKRKAKRKYFNKLANNPNPKDFWNTMKPFISDKGSYTSEDYMLEENDIIVRDNHKIANIFNDLFVNIIERSTGKSIEALSSNETIEQTIQKYRDHPSIKLIKSTHTDTNFSMPLAKEGSIKRILLNLDPRKAPGSDKIPPKIVIRSAEILSKPLTKIINATITRQKFPDNAKLTRVTPIYKNPKDGSRLKSTNYRPISVLSVFSKVIEKHYETSMNDFVNSILSKYISGFRKGHSCQHVLLRLTEEWRKQLDNNKVFGALFIDLSKAFDCLPHDLLLAKLEAYGFDMCTLKLFKSYLTKRKQFVSIHGIFSDVLEILSGVPQGSILGPILFNIFLNDLLYYVKSTNTHNYADDNVLSAATNCIDELIKILEKGADEALEWIDFNFMYANLDKFQAIISTKDKRDTKDLEIRVGNKKIKTKEEVVQLGVVIDNKLCFDLYISDLLKKASAKLNAIKRKGNYLSQSQRATLCNSYVNSYFKYCSLVWHFGSVKNIHNTEKLHERAIRFVYDDYESDYFELLKEKKLCTLYTQRLQDMCCEIYKAIKCNSSAYMNDLIKKRPSSYKSKQELDLYISKVNQVTFGYKSFSVIAPKIWNSIPKSIRALETYNTFQPEIKKITLPWCFCVNCCLKQKYLDSVFKFHHP